MRFTLISVLSLCLVAQAAPLPISAVANPWQATSKTAAPAIIIVQLANADGTPKVDAELPLANPEHPSAGVELKGSKWSFETFQIPQGFQANGIQVLPPKSVFDNPKTVAIPLPGQLRVVQIAPAFRPGTSGDPHAGIYYFSILPMFGFPGGLKQQLPWVSGHYIFRITYRDGGNIGSTLGSLVIP
ncbi:MAG: hypothetical protein ABI972_10300 [Acidobacteriota bacterium]